MVMSPQRSYYELLDIERDAKLDAIALGYQRALEALAREHDADPATRASLRKAFEVLSDPIQRMSYDLTMRPYASSAPDKDDANGTPTLTARIRGSIWGTALLAFLILIGIVIWINSGKPTGGATLPSAAQQLALAAGVSAANERSNNPTGAKSDSKSISASTAPTGPRSAEDIFSQVSQSVVRISVSNAAGLPVAGGSGVVIGPGSVITNCHVALRGELLEVKLDGTAYSASVEVANEERDLCLLGVSGLTAPAVSLGSVESVRVGQRVYAVGSPQGLDLTISDGIVSALRDSQGSKIIQTSAPVSPGSSGGGLFDTSGRMVGVVTFQTKAGQNLNFAVPADWVGEMRSH